MSMLVLMDVCLIGPERAATLQQHLDLCFHFHLFRDSKRNRAFIANSARIFDWFKGPVTILTSDVSGSTGDKNEYYPTPGSFTIIY